MCCPAFPHPVLLPSLAGAILTEFIGSYALSAARALADMPGVDAETIARKSMEVFGHSAPRRAALGYRHGHFGMPHARPRLT